MVAILNRQDPNYSSAKTTSTPVSPFPYIGYIKKNDDPQHMGRIQVWIPELGGDPVTESSWITCSYLSSFAGSTNMKKIDGYKSNPNVSQTSYGTVSVPPDLENEVMVIFVNGELSRAYWIGCPLQQNMSQMIPGVGSAKTVDGKSAPVQEYNKSATTGPVSGPSRPTFSPLSDGLDQQGMKSDGQRGSSTTSMQRESPPKMYGTLSPRGNNVHIDDDPGNEFIRLRTREGAQVLIHNTSGYVYINSKTGNSWVEISDSGIDVYSSGHINLRAKGDYNIHADGNVNIDAGGNISMRAASTFNRQAPTINDYATGSLNVSNSAGLSGKVATDAKQSGASNSGGWQQGGGTTNTITSGTPTHGPTTNKTSAVKPPPSVVRPPADGARRGAKLGNSGTASKIDSQQGNFGA